MRATYFSRLLGSALGVMTLAVLAQSGQAAGRVTGFEGGDEAIQSTGDAGTQGTYQGEAPPEGSLQYLITTIGTNTTNEDGVTKQSASNAVGSAALNTFFFGQTVSNQEGSGILVPFTVGAGDTTLSFQYDFLSNEPAQSTARADFAFDAIFTTGGVLQGSVNHFQTASQSNPANLFGAQSPFIFHTGYLTLSLNVSGLAPGTYDLGIGISDAINTSHASGLLIDNVQVSAVPEPSTLGLVLAGAASLAAVRRRIRK
jgi:hypothetical protein